MYWGGGRLPRQSQMRIVVVVQALGCSHVASMVSSGTVQQVYLVTGVIRTIMHICKSIGG